jgi:hypothetical protein
LQNDFQDLLIAWLCLAVPGCAWLCLAEGNFQVFLDRHYVRVLFRIVLHIDDIQILYTIKKFLGVGSVRVSGDHCIFSIGKQKDLVNNLFPILDEYTLLTTKYFDYLDFKKVVNLLDISSTAERPALKFKVMI